MIRFRHQGKWNRNQKLHHSCDFMFLSCPSVLFLTVNISGTPAGSALCLAQTCTQTLILIFVFIYLFTPGQRLKVDSTCDLALVPFPRPTAGTLQGIPSDFVYLDPRIHCINTGSLTKKVKVIVRNI